VAFEWLLVCGVGSVESFQHCANLFNTVHAADPWHLNCKTAVVMLYKTLTGGALGHQSALPLLMDWHLCLVLQVESLQGKVKELNMRIMALQVGAVAPAGEGGQAEIYKCSSMPASNFRLYVHFGCKASDQAAGQDAWP